MTICKKCLEYNQKLWKQYYDKVTKPRSYELKDKVYQTVKLNKIKNLTLIFIDLFWYYIWCASKYIKLKNQKIGESKISSTYYF